MLWNQLCLTHTKLIQVGQVPGICGCSLLLTYGELLGYSQTFPRRTFAGICLPLDGADLGCSNVPVLHGNTSAQRVGYPMPQPPDEGRKPRLAPEVTRVTAGAACSPRIGGPPVWPKVPLDTQRRTCCTWPGPAWRLCPKAFPESEQMQADRAHIPSQLHSRLRNFCPKGI